MKASLTDPIMVQARRARVVAKQVAFTAQHPAVRQMLVIERELTMAQRILLDKVESPFVPITRT